MPAPLRFPAVALVAAVLGSALLVASPARAFERQWHAGAKGGLATLSGRGTGLAAGVHGAYGLSDVFDVSIEGLFSRHGGSTGTDVWSGSAGLAYKVDILQWVPMVGLTGGFYEFTGRPGPHGENGARGGASFQLGLDYLALRELAFGVDLRWHTTFADGLSLPLFSAVLGAEYRWGW